MSTDLYLIALIPPEELKEQVRILKTEMRERFNASHALKAPAHITLQMPFRREPEFEERLIPELEQFSGTIQPFPVQIDGFG